MGLIEALIVILVVLFLLGFALHLIIWLTWPFLILAIILLIIRFLRKAFRKVAK